MVIKGMGARPDWTTGHFPRTMIPYFAIWTTGDAVEIAKATYETRSFVQP